MGDFHFCWWRPPVVTRGVGEFLKKTEYLESWDKEALLIVVKYMYIQEFML